MIYAYLKNEFYNNMIILWRKSRKENKIFPKPSLFSSLTSSPFRKNLRDFLLWGI